MELEQVKGNTWVLKSWELIPFYKLDDSHCILLDTGLNDQREDLEGSLREAGLTPVGVICSHAHIDHMGNVAYLKQTYGTQLAMSLGEAGHQMSYLGLNITNYLMSPEDVVESPPLHGTPCLADRIILPGVGAFADAKAKLDATGLVPVLREEAARKPLLGICLGMQLLFEKSYEYGEHGGLSFVKGEVCPLEPDLKDKTLKVPQIGWNALHIVRDDPLFRYIREGEYVYYVHSYYGKNCTGSTLAVSDYSIPVTGVVRAGRVYGTQFHPEKSGETGLRILKAFSEL